jgi:hypothetical protein
LDSGNTMWNQSLITFSITRTFLEYSFGLYDIMPETVQFECQFLYIDTHTLSLGGFYTHAEDPNGQNFPVHIPEFEANTSIGFGPDDKTFSKMIREYGLKIGGLDPILVKFPLPVPAKAVLPSSSSPSSSLSTSNIRWFGSAWAISYQIRRRVLGMHQEQDWVLIADNASDAFIYDSKAMFVDGSAMDGVVYEYEIKPRSVDGLLNHANPLILKLQASILQFQA